MPVLTSGGRALGRRAALVGTLVVAGLVLGACRYVEPSFGFVVTTDIVYGDAVNEDGLLEELELDLYTPSPDSATDRPVVIWAHGGGFVGGDKAAGPPDWVSEFAKRGYVAASINYRMDEDAGPIRVPLDDYESQRIFWAVSDLKAAIRWFRANASSLGIDPGRVAVAGSSAGAVMALSAAVLPEEPGDTGDHEGYSSAVCTALSVSGATDPARVDAGDAGAVLFHGENDTVVPFSLAEATYNAMIDAGLAAEFHVYEGEGHGIGQTHRADILGKMYPWLFEHLVGAPEPCL